MTVFWIVAAVAFLIVEAATAAMNSIWFMVGALAALAAAALGAPVWTQVLLFVAVSGVCFAILYPRLKASLRRDRQPTNADMVLGQECVVTQRIDNLAGTGAVSVGGRTWTARSAEGGCIELGAVVTADSIQGVKLMVSPVREASRSQTVSPQ